MSYQDVKDYRTRRRVKAREYLGNHCVLCGSVDTLEFDHVIPETKELEIATAIARGWSWQRLVTELDKCQLLCEDCHTTKSVDARQVPHGGGEAGRRRCTCDPCKAKKREYMRLYMRRARGSGERVLTSF